ncbi:MAG: proton-conducting transporter membrane subunit [Candidatus Binatia bacterium]
MLLGLLLVPTVTGLLSFAIRPDEVRRGLLFIAALVHSGLVIAAWMTRPAPLLGGWLELDAVGRVFLGITSILFLAAVVYALAYLQREQRTSHTDFEEGFFFVDAPEARFTGCLLLFLAAMTLVTVSQHFGVLWVAIEATTLVSAPLIFFHRHHRSLEATWKYLLICSVGIALALLGTFFLAIAAVQADGSVLPLVVSTLVQEATRLHDTWLTAAFLLFLVGYGTKMGLAPLHTWLPDAHSEAPSLVSALLSGALLNCAFLGLFRVQQVNAAAGAAAFGQELFIGFGLLSILVAAVFLQGQTDYKRLLAYSSVEHMGILALGVGLGGGGTFGALLHAVNHSLTKAMLFLVAGNILTVYQSKSTAEVRGVLRVLPVSGVLWVAGFLAITGSPPFGPFLSEFTILKAALDQGRNGVALAYLLLLAAIFVGMVSTVLGMAQGTPGAQRSQSGNAESALTVVSPAVLGTFVLLLGLYLPPPIRETLEEAARMLR